jgi:predicted DNA-binding transcriptional regulator AlpA
MDATATSVDSPKLTLTPEDFAAALSISRSQFFKQQSAGKIGPTPVYFGARAPRYLRSEVEEWLRAGAPNRLTWQRLREGGR